MKGVILAAGDGGRLWPVTRGYPKVLLPVFKRPVIAYPLEALAVAGITNVGIVVGHRAQRIVDEVPFCVPVGMTVEFIDNPDYLRGNAISVAAAREFVGNDWFVLCMGDHVIHRDMVTKLLESGNHAPAVCVDHEATHTSQIDDATRVQVVQVAVAVGAGGCCATVELGQVGEIGKGIAEWNAVDIGVFLLSPTVFTVIDRLRDEHGLEVELSQMVRYVVSHTPPFGTCDITGLFWSDIDTPDDYDSIVGFLERSLGTRV